MLQPSAILSKAKLGNLPQLNIFSQRFWETYSDLDLMRFLDLELCGHAPQQARAGLYKVINREERPG